MLPAVLAGLCITSPTWISEFYNRLPPKKQTNKKQIRDPLRKQTCEKNFSLKVSNSSSVETFGGCPDIDPCLLKFFIALMHSEVRLHYLYWNLNTFWTLLGDIWRLILIMSGMLMSSPPTPALCSRLDLPILVNHADSWGGGTFASTPPRFLTDNNGGHCSLFVIYLLSSCHFVFFF